MTCDLPLWGAIKLGAALGLGWAIGASFARVVLAVWKGAVAGWRARK